MKILGKLLQLNTLVSESNENCKVILLQTVTRVDDGKVCLTIPKLDDLLEELDIPVGISL